MAKRLMSVFALTAAAFLAFTGALFAQCPEDWITVLPDRDNTLYQDDAGILSNGAGLYLFAGQTSMPGSTQSHRMLLHFDVAGAVPDGSAVALATLQMTSFHQELIPLTLHRVTSNWGEGTSQGAGDEDEGGVATAGDATWLHTFFNTGFWTTPGGDHIEEPTTETLVGSTPGVYLWEGLQHDVQGWIEDENSNFGWIIHNDLHGWGGLARFGSRTHTNNEPRLCLQLCSGSEACAIFVDGFETGKIWGWDSIP